MSEQSCGENTEMMDDQPSVAASETVDTSSSNDSEEQATISVIDAADSGDGSEEQTNDPEQAAATNSVETNDAEFTANDDVSDSDSDSDNSYIDNMLEQNFDVESLKTESCKRKLKEIEDKELKNETKKRIVLIKSEQDHFEILPEGWVEITHYSGMPIYLHKESRVCSMSKPYYLGTGSARKHKVPLSAIPCLQYRRELEKEAKEDESSCITPIAKVETLENSKKERSLDSETILEYCKNLFKFKHINVQKFKTWSERRKHTQQKKLAQRPSLPESTKLITCTVPKNSPGNVSGKGSKKEFIMNPAGKSYVCILHEYVQHTGRTQPKYIFQELENVSKPYCATVIINDMEYGKGYGSSKKEAKTEAARASLDILIPDLKSTAKEHVNKDDSLNDLSFFDNIRIEDQRVSELCLKAGQYSPYQILVECLRRHYGFEDMDIETEVKLLKHQKNEFTMKVGNHTASVICKNKREGKQRAAQAILQLLHSDLTSWGSLLKLYGRGSCKTPKEKKEEAQQITELQNSACSNRPNYAILDKLKEEMLKLKNRPIPTNLTLAPINIQLSTETV